MSTNSTTTSGPVQAESEDQPIVRSPFGGPSRYIGLDSRDIDEMIADAREQGRGYGLSEAMVERLSEEDHWDRLDLHQQTMIALKIYRESASPGSLESDEAQD